MTIESRECVNVVNIVNVVNVAKADSGDGEQAFSNGNDWLRS
jgi:hypothetical protein